MAQKSKRSGKVLIYLALLLIFGVILVWVLYVSPQTSANQAAEVVPTPGEEMSSIVISIQPIKFGNVVTPDMVTVIPYPKRLLIPGVFFTDINEVVGKKVTMDLAAKIPITSSLITESPTGSIESYMIPEGMVAISIPVPNPLSSVGYTIKPGDHINVIGTMMFVDVDAEFQSRLPNLSAMVIPGAGTTDLPSMVAFVQSLAVPSPKGRAEQDVSLAQPLYLLPSELQRPRIVSQTILQNVVVLQVGETIDEEIEAEMEIQPTPTPTTQEQPVTKTIIRPKIITIIVTPQDAVALNYLVYSGVQMNMVLRSAGDDQMVQTDSVSLQYAMDTYQIKLPVKLPYSIEPAITILSLPNVDPSPTPY
ncbi:MAG: hypothetical protein C0391_01190 [Anaerolinea sp.]|nr:hypothetical protein [Anaerolinea sp.]